MAAKILRNTASLTTNYTATTIRPERQLYGRSPYSCQKPHFVKRNNFCEGRGGIFATDLSRIAKPASGRLFKEGESPSRRGQSFIHAHKPSSTTKEEPCHHSQPPRSNLNLEGSPRKKTTRRWRLPCAAADAAIKPSPSPSWSS